MFLFLHFPLSSSPLLSLLILHLIFQVFSFLPVALSSGVEPARPPTARHRKATHQHCCTGPSRPALVSSAPRTAGLPTETACGAPREGKPERDKNRYKRALPWPAPRGLRRCIPGPASVACHWREHQARSTSGIPQPPTPPPHRPPPYECTRRLPNPQRHQERAQLTRTPSCRRGAGRRRMAAWGRAGAGAAATGGRWPGRRCWGCASRRPSRWTGC